MNARRRHTAKVAKDRRTESFGIYRIVAGETSAGCRAAAYAGSRLIASAAGDSVDQAVSDIEHKLKDRQAAMRSRREDGAPTREEFFEALLAIAPSLPETTFILLHDHVRQPAITTALSDVERRTNQESGEATKHYLRLARQLATALDHQPPNATPEGVPPALGVLGTVTTGYERSSVVIRLAPALAEALADLGDAESAFIPWQSAS